MSEALAYNKAVFEQSIKTLAAQILTDLERIDSEVDRLGLKDEQWVLDFYDKLNEISVRK